MNITDKLQNIYKSFDSHTGGILDTMKTAIDNFSQARGSQAAASMAYYALFSLFPLLLVLVAAGSYFLDGYSVQRVMNLVTEAIPVSRSLIVRNLQQVLDLRGTVGLIGLLTLLWSASGVFGVLDTNINLAWPTAEQRSFLKQRIMAIGIIGILFVLLIVSLGGSAAIQILDQLQFPSLEGVQVHGIYIWSLFSNILSWFFAFVLLVALYRWLPNTDVAWVSAFWGALFSATAWKIATSVFVWYLGSGLSRYELVYGSLGAVIALLLLTYISSLIILFGAHLSSAVQLSPEGEESHS